jgi:hypothetical protein
VSQIQIISIHHPTLASINRFAVVAHQIYLAFLRSVEISIRIFPPSAFSAFLFNAQVVLLTPVSTASTRFGEL